MSELGSGDLDLVLAVEQDILQHPDRYQEAVLWWNENHARQVYRKKVAGELRGRRRAGEKAHRSRDSWRLEHRARWFFLTRVRDAMRSFPTDPARWRRLSHQDAARILLVTALITRPGFDGVDVGLDEQTQWSHGTVLDGDECFGRDWADGSFPEWNDDDGDNRLWMKLASAAWTIMQAGACTEPDSPASEAANWLSPAEAMSWLKVGDKTEPERRRIFERLRQAMPTEQRRKVGKAEHVEIEAWRTICRTLQSRASMSSDWSDAVDDVAEIEARKAAERHRKQAG